MEMIRYIIIGGLTTLINFIIYDALIYGLHLHWSVANTFAWAGAVIFAFITNKKIVFKNESSSLWKEIISFTSLRFATLVCENILLFIFIQSMSVNEMISKLIVSVVTIILNYVFCKKIIFKKDSEEVKGDMNYGYH